MVRKERLGAKDKIIVPTCPRRLSRGTLVLLARYSALATIIIFSLGIWCHKFDLVISFTSCARATKRDGSHGEDAGPAEKKEERGDNAGKRVRKIRNVLRATGTPLLPKNVILYKLGCIRWNIILRTNITDFLRNIRIIFP